MAILITLYGAIPATAQIKSSFTDTYISVTSNPIISDSLLVVPESVIVKETTDSNENIPAYVEGSNIFLLKEDFEKYKGKRLNVSYRVMPVHLERRYMALDSNQMKPFNDSIYIGYKKPGVATNIFDASDLNYNGSFSRGFSLGNAQSLVLNSNFNLQLQGNLGNDIQVSAAISDDNIPIQPEGNTQLLQEFDKVFIKVSKGKTAVTAGDYLLSTPKGYFTKYSKKLKGLAIDNTVDYEGLSITSNASVAVSRGKFARQNLIVTEGNQGPYKLVGNNGERFLIVLSGTEKVYLDGRLLERGLDYDYVIDYNRAEVTFTPKRLVRRESRFIVEFEYTEQSYLRTLYSFNTYLKNDKWDVNVNVYSEQDSKTATGDIVLDSLDIAKLRASGDDPNLSVRSGIFANQDTSRTIGRITYVQVPNDNPTNPEDSTILVYSTDNSLPLVTAAFSEVPEGSYTIDDETDANGRVYKYVGAGLGSYNPVIKLTPPELKQLISLGARYNLSKNTNIYGELSVSRNDINRLSIIDDGDNNGLAGLLGLTHKVKIGNKWSVRTDASLEQLESDYKALNPYRDAEFTRDWNLNNVRIGKQQLINAGVDLSRTDSLAIGYKISSYGVGNYQGFRHTIDSKWLLPFGLNTYANIRTLSSDDEIESTAFDRYLSGVSYTFSNDSKIKIGIDYDGERNRRRNLANNTLNSISRGYDLTRGYIQNDESTRLHYQASASVRTDYFADSLQLAESILTKELSFLSRWTISNNHNLSALISYRDFNVTNADLAVDLSDKKSLVGTIDYNIAKLNGGIISNTSYNVTSGQQPKVEFYFEKVPVGQGDYTYFGNEDSTLVASNFRYAPDLNTGNYIRLSLVNGEFINTDNQVLSQSLRLTPKKIWKSTKSPFYKVLNKLSTLSSIRVNKKVNTSSNTRFFDFTKAGDDIVEYNALMLNTLFINKGGLAYDVQLSQKSVSSIFTQVSGLEERGEDQYSLKSRVKFYQRSDVIFESNIGQRRYESEVFAIRNYKIDFWDVSPKISLRPADNLRVIVGYTFDRRKDDTTRENTISSTNNEYSFDINYRKASALSINLGMSYVDVTYDGPENSPIEFDLLRGLKGGRNILWTSNITKRLKNNIDVSFSYEGRKNGTNRTVHIGRAQVKATF